MMRFDRRDMILSGAAALLCGTAFAAGRLLDGRTHDEIPRGVQ